MKLSPWFVVAALIVAAPSRAFAATKAECVAAYDEGQKLRASGALGAAREAFLVCANPECPNATQNDCTQWVGEVDASMPTVAFAVTADGGKDVTDVAVFVDGAPLATTLDGKALPIDPGKHALRFERGGKTIEMELVVREGEKNRAVPVAFDEPVAPPPEGGGTLSPGVWILGGVGVAGLGLFAVMGGVALGERSDAQDTCAPRCTDDEVGSIRTKFIVADVSLGVGLASLAGAVILGVIDVTSGGDAPAAPPTEAFVVRPFGGPLPGGACAGVLGTF